jgi:c-di-GMP-binding flagellar brake protein YcgR
MSEQERRRYPRAKLKWPVLAKVDDGIIEGVTKDISAGGAYVHCAKPLKLNVVFTMVIKTPDKQLKAKAEVVWSNIYGPDDAINPRGMGVIFLNISEEDQRFISKAVNQHIADTEKVPTEQMATLVVDAE